ncbi:MAG: sulfatase-like hydrolase/transferase [Acidobacteria bacterium]|nr:sulfatase-like hydrolase/transferase [Acidobacteriota bacterium]
MYFRVLWACLALAGALSAAPNFLIFIADDLGEGDLSIYGHPVLETPNIDRIGREGMVFDRAFLTISSCSPSRTSILTGRYPHNTHAEDLHLPLPADQVTFARALHAKGYHSAAIGKWHLGEAERAHWDAIAECSGAETANKAVAQLRSRPKDKPFFFWVASKDPHRPFDKDAIAQPHRPEDVHLPPYLPDHPLIREDIARYYDEATRFDNHVGEILAELEAQGALDDTVIVFLSDNGMPFPRAKTTLYDAGIHTPFLVRYPPLVPKGKLQGNLFSVVDLIPTLLEIAGVASKTIGGSSQLEMFRNPEAAGREAVYAEANWHDFEQFTRAVRTERYLLVRNYYWQKPLWASVDAVNSITWRGFMAALRAGDTTPAQRFLLQEPRPFEEFYDLQVDPSSLENVAGRPRYEAEYNRHRILLDNWRVETADKMPQEPRPDGWTRDGRPLPHNQPWYDNFIKAGGRNNFETF